MPNWKCISVMYQKNVPHQVLLISHCNCYYEKISNLTQQSSRLQCHASSVDVLDKLPEYVGFELFDD